MQLGVQDEALSCAGPDIRRRMCAAGVRSSNIDKWRCAEALLCCQPFLILGQRATHTWQPLHTCFIVHHCPLPQMVLMRRH